MNCSNGLIKLYNYEGELGFEGEYLNGKRNGKGKEYYFDGNIRFEGEYLNGNRWNGNGNDPDNNIVYSLKDGNGLIKEYYYNGKLEFEGEYLNGERNGKGKEYFHYGFFDREFGHFNYLFLEKDDFFLYKIKILLQFKF